MKNDTRLKDGNPKDRIGIEKVPFSTVPAPVIAEIGLGLLEGALKYGRHNYRAIGVRYSVYYDAAMRHITAWWEGEDIDPDSGLSHITKALSTLTVLRDAMLNDKYEDDRPPKFAEPGWIAEYNKKAKELIAKYPNPKAPYTEKGQQTGPDTSQVTGTGDTRMSKADWEQKHPGGGHDSWKSYKELGY